MIVLYHKTGKAIARAIRRIKKIKDKEYIDRLMNVTAMILDVTAIILDPLFFYILVLDDEKKCIHWDKTLGITATVIRSVLDFLKLGHFISHSKLHMEKGNQREKFKAIFKGEGEVPEDPMGRMRKLFLIDCLAILPIPQVLVIFLVIFGIRGPGFSTAMTFFVLQYSLRVIRTYFLFTHATRVSGILADATWAIFAFYLLLYLQSGHMFGALWYYYAIEKATECWREACKNHTGCSGHSYFSCNKSSRDYNFLNDFCRISTGSTTSYSFGIYNDALQSGIVGETDFPKKLIRCLRWGLQNLRFAVFYMAWIMITVHVISAFGQNLETSNDVGENIFAICMTNYGVVLFVFLIGRMQTEIARSQKINQKWQVIRQSKHYADISRDQNVRGQFKKAKREKLTNKHVDVRIDSFISDLSLDAEKEVKRHMGRKLLRKVEEFQNWDEFSLDYLFGCLKPVVFSERTVIIQEGDPINVMTFVLQGKTWAYSKKLSITIQRHQDHCDVRRKELIDWAKNENSYQQLPISDRTVRALTDVEAFTLKADDVKCALLFRPVSKEAAALIQLVWRFKKHKRANDKNAKPRSCLDCCFRTPDEGELH
ncbi:hypothetical protein CISIN_1g042686mg [Citrus sinensis]|uniref:Cyclic nucleotide-binding domain-containing protein n=1 Tax=Citrus sinensis TaxID=2711 RepID=A0A067ELK7_CITSI|nr:hypothetical protein CISIN_1g042686mg [Citrus sinensis]